MAQRRKPFLEELRKAGFPGLDLEKADHYLLHIIDEGTLGAGNHVKLIQELLQYLGKSLSGDNFLPAVTIFRKCIDETRGQEAPVISNSMHLLLRDLEKESPQDQIKIINHRIEEWSAASARRLEELVETGKNVLKDSSRILLFDYSSTVEAVANGLLNHSNNPPGFVVFESRIIDGGWPYVQKFLTQGHPVRYVPDAAILQECQNADAVLLGVENLRCDGSLTNTLGSQLIAKTARGLGLDVFGCCDLFKLDLRSYKEIFKQPVTKNYDSLFLKSRDPKPASKQSALIDTNTPELEVVPPELLTGFITDHGLIRPDEIYQKGIEIFPEAGEATDE